MHLQFQNLHALIYITNYILHLFGNIPVCSFACKIHCLPHLSQFYLIMASLPRIICSVNIYYTAYYLRTACYIQCTKCFNALSSNVILSQ